LSYALFCLAHAILDCAQLKIDSAIDWADKGLNLSAKTGVHLADRMLLSGKTLAATISGNSSWAETALALSEPLVDSASELDNGMLQYQRAGVLAMKSDYANALEKLNGLSDRLLSTGGTAAATFAELLQAQVLALNRQPIAARASLTKSRYFASHLPSPMMAFQTEMVKAYSWLIEGNKGKGIAALRRTMTIGHSIDAMTMTPFWLPHLITPLCAQALEYGIEFDYVKELIKRRGLTPASPAIEAWPWPIRVFTLGRFAILINDTPLIFSGKSQKKPLNLLKALIAMGGRAISTDTLASTLWENNDASDAKHALDMAVSRLRKILDNENAIVVYDGKLSLNDKLVWVDAQAFERNASELETMAPDTAAEKKHAFAQKAIDRYNGIFLRGDEESAWLLGRRDHLHSRYVRLVISHGNALEREVKHDSAKTCYLKALELDPLAEEIYQRLMSCHLEQGEQAQALEAYRRCKQMLSIVLGVAPSQRTEALATRARAAAHYGHE
jgi:DNA-binding SARP family transcriptional activator